MVDYGRTVSSAQSGNEYIMVSVKISSFDEEIEEITDQFDLQIKSRFSKQRKERDLLGFPNLAGLSNICTY